jgi:cutinase
MKGRSISASLVASKYFKPSIFIIILLIMKFPSALVFLSLLSLALTAPVQQIEERDLNGFLAKIAALMPFTGLIQDISGLLIAGENALAWIFGINTNENGLSGGCTAVTVIWARGTTEPGNVGVLVGPPFFDALRSRIGGGNVAVQGVPYNADVEGFLVGGSPGGGQMM